MNSSGQRRAVVTGGSGFIGSQVTCALRERGVDTVVVSRSAQGENAVRADVRDRDAMLSVLAPGDTVVHLANRSNPTTPEADPNPNVEKNPGDTAQLRMDPRTG